MRKAGGVVSMGQRGETVSGQCRQKARRHEAHVEGEIVHTSHDSRLMVTYCTLVPRTMSDLLKHDFIIPRLLHQLGLFCVPNVSALTMSLSVVATRE